MKYQEGYAPIIHIYEIQLSYWLRKWIAAIIDGDRFEGSRFSLVTFDQKAPRVGKEMATDIVSPI